MQLFKYPVSINLWLGNNSCTLFDYDLNSIKEQLLTLLRQLEVSDTNDNTFEVTVICKMSGVTTIYNGDNKDKVVALVKQILNDYDVLDKNVKVDVGNNILNN
jgi:uncharacterized protein YxjI